MIRIDNVKLPLLYDNDDLQHIAAKKLRLKETDLVGVTLGKRSVDARDKGNVHYVASLRVQVKSGEKNIVAKARDKKIYREKPVEYQKPTVNYQGKYRPVVVGSGPAGLFAALAFGEAGLNPLVIERGKEVQERLKDIALLRSEGVLNPESNVQFGHGGAGTFSDGKLNTGTKSSAHRRILETFVEAGADEDILWESKPHIGSDVLVKVVANLTRRIQELGGEVSFKTRLCDIEIKDGDLTGIVLEKEGEREAIPCDCLVLAIGHSARDTYQLLYDKGMVMTPKNFAIGVRIEHLQEDIDKAQYGAVLPCGPASYKLAAHLPNGRGVYTFCMCPGGEVMTGTSQVGGVVTNGMSNRSRDGINSNSALLVGVSSSDFGTSHPLGGIEFQRKIERAAFYAGGGGYKAPCETVGSLLGISENKIGRVEPTYHPNVTMTKIHRCLPRFVVDSLKEGLLLLDKKLHGFAGQDSLLTAPETRTSAPVRLVRDENFESSIKGIFPVGEGSGYAGGIMSAAADGLRVSQGIISNFSS